MLYEVITAISWEEGFRSLRIIEGIKSDKKSDEEYMYSGLSFGRVIILKMARESRRSWWKIRDETERLVNGESDNFV